MSFHNNLIISKYWKVCPFMCDMDVAPSDVQLDLIDLQSDAEMRRQAQRTLVLFGSAVGGKSG